MVTTFDKCSTMPILTYGCKGKSKFYTYCDDLNNLTCQRQDDTADKKYLFDINFYVQLRHVRGDIIDWFCLVCSRIDIFRKFT